VKHSHAVGPFHTGKFVSKVAFESRLSEENFQVWMVHFRKFITFESGPFTPESFLSNVDFQKKLSSNFPVWKRPYIYASVPARLLPSSLWCRVTASSLIRRSTTAECTAPEEKYTCHARRAFSVAGLLVWNSLPDYLRDWQLAETFSKHLKTFLYVVC